MFQLGKRSPIYFQLKTESKMKHPIGTHWYNMHAYSNARILDSNSSTILTGKKCKMLNKTLINITPQQRPSLNINNGPHRERKSITEWIIQPIGQQNSNGIQLRFLNQNLRIESSNLPNPESPNTTIQQRILLRNAIRSNG